VEPPTELPGPAGDILLRGTAAVSSFIIEGELVAVCGSEQRGVHAIHISGRRRVADLQTDAGRGVNVLLTPACTKRELIGRSGATLETVLAVPTLPLVALQWCAPPGAPKPKGLDLSMVVLPDEADVRYRVYDGGLRATPGDADDDVVDLRMWPAPASWQVSEEPGGGIRVRISVEPAAAVTLFVAGGNAQRSAQALSSGRHLRAHARRAETEADLGAAETLVTGTGVDEIDHGVLWATRRVQAALRRTERHAPRADPDAAGLFWTGAGAVAVGDTEMARVASRALRGAPGHVDPGFGPPLPTGALATLLDARIGLTGGRARDPDALRKTFHEEVAGPAEGRTGPRRLPMVGEASAAGSGALLEALLFPGTHGGGHGHPAVPELLESWAGFSADAPEDAYTLWRAQLSRGLDGGPEGRGAWDGGPDALPFTAPRAGSVLASLAYGLLGLDADAPAGRIGIAPRLPGHLGSFHVHGIRVGDSRLSLAYGRSGGSHRFELALTQGREPPMAILAPILPCRAIEAVRIDGQPAELDVSAVGTGWREQAQLPVDGRRVLEVDTV
jgi:hypothetical protein